MTRRPAVTLMEVLIAMFIMAIGMLALLALFPVGAVSMAQALKDDRCAATAYMAENTAIAMNVRYDPNVSTKFAALITAGSQPLVYVDPYGAQQGLAVVGATAIPRITTSVITTPQLADRWFSLPDDITFNKSGTPDTSTTGGTIIDRGRRYSFAYLARQMQPTNLVKLYAVVYSSRPTATLETTDISAIITSTNSVQLSLPLPAVNVKRGGWILDAAGNFYRVTNIVDVGGGSPLLEIQQNFPYPLGTTVALVLMDSVAEVFDKGTGWQQ